MTLASLVELARKELQRTDPADAYIAAEYLAQGILDLFAEADPCGWEEPFARTYGGMGYETELVVVPSTWGASVTPDDARAMGRMLFRCADEADEETEKRAIRAALNKSTAPVK